MLEPRIVHMANGRFNTLTIRTPEGISFSFVLAGPVPRFLAWVIDQAAIMVAMFVVQMVVSVIGFALPDLAMAMMYIIYFVISLGYGIILEWRWRGQTIGKRVLHLRVADAGGLQLHFSQIVLRNLLRVADSLPALYLLGGLTVLLNRRYQRLGDIAANTIVTRIPPSGMPDVSQIMGDKFNSFCDYAYLTARLRQRISPAEANLALRAILRRGELDPDKRLTMFAEMANHYRRVIDFPEDATIGLTDEQYIRNIVDCIYNSHSNTSQLAVQNSTVGAKEAPRPDRVRA